MGTGRGAPPSQWVRLLVAGQLVVLAVTVGVLVLPGPPGSETDNLQGSTEGQGSGPASVTDGTRAAVLGVFDALVDSWDDTRAQLAAVPGDSPDHLRGAASSYLDALGRAADDLDRLPVPVAVQDEVRTTVALLHQQQALLDAALEALASGNHDGFAAHLGDLRRSTSELTAKRSQLARVLGT